jgi:hypothetical protein
MEQEFCQKRSMRHLGLQNLAIGHFVINYDPIRDIMTENRKSKRWFSPRCFVFCPENQPKRPETGYICARFGKKQEGNPLND